MMSDSIHPEIIFEFTTYCNFNCEHCYNGLVPRQTEIRLDRLSAAAKTFLHMGILRFDLSAARSPGMEMAGSY